MHSNSLEITPFLYDSAHKTPSRIKLKSGNSRVQIRRKGQYASKTFSNKSDALSWSFESDRRTDQGRGIIAPNITEFNTFGQFIDLHIADMIEVDKPLGARKILLFALSTST